jgi:predicted amidophosphoribosyltransferase
MTFTSISFIAKLLFRPRPTEEAAHLLTLADLQALARYDGTLPYHEYRVRALLWEVKYYAAGYAVKLAGEYLAELLLAEAADIVGTPLLLPMPMHKKRRRERGHNQTEVLCESALESLGVGKNRFKKVLGSPSAVFGQPSGQTIFASIFSYVPDILRRTRHTKPQQGLERHDRLKNLKNSMEVSDPAKVKGRVCIVVDDVSTTGASFAEAKRALKLAGARDVRCVALAQS